ncbi:peptidoglycan editing factor PgeF [Vallicoccus soli]|uniref:Purine nucleoside phosphorylase n=1 Tax=Vallicoccus soli TaxID=2339232 RepID=A0A3A3Z1R5_9ACTN|nr:peptidoglycan editing factor PgeF [Vallicoccus soli]
MPAGLPAGATGAFTTRHGGVVAAPYGAANLGLHVGDEPARVLAHRAALGDRLGGAVRFAQQVHGAGVLVVDERVPAPGQDAPGVDALVTALPGVPVAALVADCVPVLLADVVGGVVAAAHAGRQGLVRGVLEATVAAMTGLGADPARTVAVVGPCAGACCYEVPAALRDEVAALVPGTAATTRRGTPALDLPAGALGVLRRAGVGEVRVLGACTIDDERFYSYRREGVTGRMAGVVVLDPPGRRG